MKNPNVTIEKEVIMKKHIILILAILGFTVQMVAQNFQHTDFNYEASTDAQTTFEETNWIVYDTLNSDLPNNCVLSIAIEGNGTKWIGTSNYFGGAMDDEEAGGLAAFDGINWTVYNTSNSGLPENTVYTIAIEGNGTKWIGTGFTFVGNSTNLASFDGTNWTAYSPSNFSLGCAPVWCLAIEENGTKWIGPGKENRNYSCGLLAYDETNWTVYDTANSGLTGMEISSITIDRDGTKWIGPMGKGLIAFDNTNWTVYNTSNSGLPSNSVLAIAIDSDGTKWIGTGSWWGGYNAAGLAAFDGANWIVFDTLNSGLPDNAISAIAIDSDGTIWIGTQHKGLVAFDGSNWTVFDTSNSELPDNTINSIVIDGHGTKWIGTWNGGLAAYNENGIPDWTYVNETESQQARVYPNPATNQITVEFDQNGQAPASIMLFDIPGKEVYSEKINSTATTHTLNLSSLRKGIYLIRISNDEYSVTKKVIKVE